MTAVNDWRVMAVVGVIVWVMYRQVTRDAAAVVTSVGSGIKKVSDGIAFDKASMGPKAAASADAERRTTEAIRQGYMQRLPSGRVVITAKGERLIASGKSLRDVIP